MTDILRKASIVQGLVLPCGCCKADQIRDGQRHRWPKARKLITELFMGFVGKVTEKETELLQVLGLPEINRVREAELDNLDGEEGTFRYTEKMDGQVKDLFQEWTVELIGTELAKQVDPLDALYPRAMLEMFSLGLSEFLKLVENEMGGPSEEELERLRLAPSLTNPYLKAIVRAGGKRIKTELAVENLRAVRKQLLRMAREGENPMRVGRWLHKKIGEGNSWYWNRIALSESALAIDGAFEASMKEYRVPMSEWSAAPTACEICAYLDGRVWRVGEGPRPVTDTHPSCLCLRMPTYVTRKPVQERWLRPNPYEVPYTREELELLGRRR